MDLKSLKNFKDIFVCLGEMFLLYRCFSIFSITSLMYFLIKIYALCNYRKRVMAFFCPDYAVTLQWLTQNESIAEIIKNFFSVKFIYFYKIIFWNGFTSTSTVYDDFKSTLCWIIKLSAFQKRHKVYFDQASSVGSQN